jgi:hypothetical protein
MHRRRLLALLPAALAAAACSDNNADCEDLEDPQQRLDCVGGRDNPAAPTPPPPPPRVHDFEFRVTGTLAGATIALTSTSEGTTTITTDLPWFATIKSPRTQMFLGLTAAAFGIGTVTVQLFVDGVLFREATVTGIDPKASISGQWSA